MEINHLKKLIREKSMAFEVAMEMERPHSELNQIYRELKELQFQLMQLDLELSMEPSDRQLQQQ